MRIKVSLASSEKTRPAPEIIEQGLTTVENLLFRGKQELWAEVGNIRELDIEVTEFINPWSIAKVQDKHGENFYALAKSFSINITPESQNFSISAERVL